MRKLLITTSKIRMSSFIHQLRSCKQNVLKAKFFESKAVYRTTRDERIESNERIAFIDNHVTF